MVDEVGNNSEVQRKLAIKIAELPELPENSVRVVHLAHLTKVDEIVESGLSYKNQGMAMSTARAWSNPSEVEYSSDDPRFQGDDIRAVVLDMTNDEWKMHNKVGVAPGMISAEKIVGVINPARK